MLLFRSNYSKFCPTQHIKDVKKYFIEMPKLLSNYDDKVITRYLKRVLPTQYFNEINRDLISFSHKMENDYFHLHKQCESTQPRLEKYDGWGKQIDNLVTCGAWKRLKSIASEEGLIGIAYENKYREYSRIYQGVKLILFSSLSGLTSCPLAMTDGAAFVLRKLGPPEETRAAFERLISRESALSWSSGQWMTEKHGGSDVARATQTVALWDNHDNCYRLYGYKWFSSASDANMALTLARCLDGAGVPIPGNGGLALFYVEILSDRKNGWNELEIVSLKDKLGTRQLPTSELLLNGLKSIKLSETGRGISSIAGMLTITRIHNAIAAVSGMRRIVLLATEYSKKRESFGSLMIDKPLHASVLADLDIESRAAFYFVMDVMKLLGLQENQMATKEDLAMMRILSPLLKLYTAKQAMNVISEGLECFGGQGYIESTGLPGMLRDAQVLPIWEGTTNILSLDVLRSLNLDNSNTEIFKIFKKKCLDKLQNLNNKDYSEENRHLTNSILTLEKFISNNYPNVSLMQLSSRRLAFAMSRIYMGILLLEEATQNYSDISDRLSLLHWVKKDLVCGLDKVTGDIKHEDWMRFFE